MCLHLAETTRLMAGGGENYIKGGSGDDILKGGKDDDILDGGSGADILIGGTGTDWATYAASSVGLTVDMTDPTRSTGIAQGDTFSSIELLIGSAYNDDLAGFSDWGR
jgi:Ca2+-binding RTX toxin-like protein